MYRCATVLVALWLGLNVSTVIAGDQPDPGERYLRMAAESGVTPGQKAAYYQLSLIHSFEPPLLVPGGPILGPGLPETCVFYAMGIESLPILAKALDDTSPTPTTALPRMPGEKPYTYKVNDLVARIICEVAEREFVVGRGMQQRSLSHSSLGKHPDLVPEFKNAVLDWYDRYRNMPIAQRNIDDINDDYLNNRFRAIEWLGEHKEKSGQEPILARVATLLPTPDNDVQANWELGRCAMALGQLGDRAASLGPVQQICQRFSSEKCQRNNVLGKRELFKAYHGLALLGEKDEALRELNRVYDAYYTDKPASDQQQFKEELAAAEKW